MLTRLKIDKNMANLTSINKRYFSLTAALLMTASSLSLTGCQSIKLDGGKGTPQQTAAPGANSTAANLDGAWQISYEYNGQPMSCHIKLTQNGSGFSGTGVDDHNQQAFVIDSGLITGNSILFHKRYHVNENPNLPPIIYQGNFQMMSAAEYTGPYMSGTYELTKGGKPISGRWDAQKEGFGPAPAASAGQSPTPPPQDAGPVTQAVPSGKAPHLSGRYDMGYEYDFKTIKSTLYMEQDNTKITGHGIDKGSKETFTVSGNYKFPDIKLWLKYNAVKASKKGKAKPERSLEFRGTVANINDAEYQGPRLQGQTNGGGAWMAEQVR